MSDDRRAEAAAAADRLLALAAKACEFERRQQTAGDLLRVPAARYALALLRQRIRPALDRTWVTVDPPHLAVFGGTNSGKSTLLNLLLGCSAAEMSFRARHTQHPEAYLPGGIAGTAFLDQFPTRFEGYARFPPPSGSPARPPRQTDRDLAEHGYRPALGVQRLEQFAPRQAPPIAEACIFWDVPDFSTEEAQYYLGAVLDAVATADLVVMTVTGESYADYRGELLRELLLAAGTPLVVVANKLESAASRLLADIQTKVGQTGAAQVLPLPHVRGEEDHARLAALHEQPDAVALRANLAARIADPELKSRALRGSVAFLESRWPALIAPLVQETALADRWQARVTELARRELFDRYRRDYLNHKDYEVFNDVVREFLKLLELPWIGQAVRWVADRIRSPLAWAAAGVRSWLFPTPVDEASPEEKVVQAGYEQWRELLMAEAEGEAQRTGHPGWRQLVMRLSDPAMAAAEREALTAALAEHDERMKVVIHERADDLFRHLATNPVVMRSLQGLKFTLDVALTVSAAAWTFGGIDPWDLVLAPLVPPTVSLLIELGFRQYVEQQKEVLKEEQLAALAGVLDARLVGPMRDRFPVPAAAADLARADADLRLVASELSSTS